MIHNSDDLVLKSIEGVDVAERDFVFIRQNEFISGLIIECEDVDTFVLFFDEQQ